MKISMSPLLLRITAVVYFLFFAGHTFGAMFKDPKGGGPEKQAVLLAMRTYRSYWNFYQGFGFYVSCALLAFTILSGQLGSTSPFSPSQISSPLQRSSRPSPHCS
jgi:hypothetical protein